MGADLLPLATDLEAARSQMAFTLGFHIILASMGVAFPAIILTANYIGLRRGDDDALRLAQRWSKVAAVLFAVGAITGTVLSFEMGLLWPEFMSRFGEVFGPAFALEGVFFFLEAIFIAIYIFGWKRLSGWAHFWTGVPIVIAGIGGAFSVVAVNSWMNQPQGYTLNSNGEVTDVDVWKVIFIFGWKRLRPWVHFWTGVPVVLSGLGGALSVVAVNAWMNTPGGFKVASDGSLTDVDPVDALLSKAFAYEVPHMILAAYMVAGFLVASVYAVGMLRGRRDRHHRLGLLIPLTLALIVTPIQLGVGDTAARAIAEDQPIKFAAMVCVQTTHSHVTEYIGGRCTEDGVKGGIGIPGLDSWLVGFSTDTKVTGLDSVPPDDRPPANTMLHWAFDIMVGIGSALMLLGLWLGATWLFRRDMPRSPWFLRATAVSGVAAVVALECGWIVTEVGRQPWIVYGYMRTEDAVTEASGVWISLTVVLLLYAAVGTATVVVLRAMTRRWRTAELDESEGPYGPRPDLRELSEEPT